MDVYLKRRLHRTPADLETTTKRIHALRRLKKNLCGPTCGKSIRHYCPLGCHSSRAAAAEELYQDLVTLLLTSPPPIPSYNKWDHMLPAVLFFTVFTLLHGISRLSFPG